MRYNLKKSFRIDNLIIGSQFTYNVIEEKPSFFYIVIIYLLTYFYLKEKMLIFSIWYIVVCSIATDNQSS